MRRLWVTDEMRTRCGDEIWEKRVPGGKWRRVIAEEIPPSFAGVLREGDWLLYTPLYTPPPPPRFE